MRTLTIAFAFVCALLTVSAFAQRRPATEAEAQSYIMSAFLSQADPGSMSPGVALGPELEMEFKLPPGTDRAEVYEAVMSLTGEERLEVRRATPAEIADYGRRRNLDTSSPHPLFTVSDGQISLLLQYDLQALNILFVGQLGLPDPDPVPAVAALGPGTLAPQTGLVNVAWTAEFAFNSTKLSPDAIAKLDKEVVPKLAGSKEIRYLHLYGHSDRIGSAEYNRRLSERRAEAVRAYLVSKGIDAGKIEVFGYGKTLPVKSCTEHKERAALIACLAPNRRIVVEVQAMP